MVYDNTQEYSDTMNDLIFRFNHICYFSFVTIYEFCNFFAHELGYLLLDCSQLRGIGFCNTKVIITFFIH